MQTKQAFEPQFKVGDQVVIWHPWEDRKVRATIVEIILTSFSPVKYWLSCPNDDGPPMWLDYGYDNGRWKRWSSSPEDPSFRFQGLT